MPKLGMEPIRKAQVISSVLELMAQTGLNSLTMEAVAARAGVSKGVVNHYFKGKRDLLRQSFQAFLDGYSRTIAEKLEQSNNAAEMLENIARSALSGPEMLLLADGGQPGPDLSPGDIGRLMVHFMGLCLVDDEFHRIYTRIYKVWLEGTAEVIQYGIQTGVFKQTDPLSTAHGFMALVDGAAFHASMDLNPAGPGDKAGVYRKYIDDLLARPAKK